jgi:ATP-dependent Lhr-like helicase
VAIRPAALGSDQPALWFAAERLPEMNAVHVDRTVDGSAAPPESRTARSWSREEALIELSRGRLTIVGPTTARAVAASLGVAEAEAEAALIALESEGAVLRGSFTSGSPELEWCDRRLLARIHRYTLNRLRAEIEPVSAAHFMRFLLAWQHVDPSARLTGVDGLRSIVGMLDGFELAAAAWEREVLPARMDRYDKGMLDTLCLTGEVGWARWSLPSAAAPASGHMAAATPIALFLREHGQAWRIMRQSTADHAVDGERVLNEPARRVFDVLRQRGALFLREIAAGCAMDSGGAAAALGDLVAAGLVTSDGFAGVRALLHAGRRPAAKDSRAASAGRWSALDSSSLTCSFDEALEVQAWSLLRRYGVIFRRMLLRESNAAPWRDLARVYRRLEARGEIRGGRFVSGMSGEQFALPDAVERLREVRRTARDGRLLAISAADPLNLTGVLSEGDRIRAVASNRIVYQDGIPVAALEGDYLRPLATIAETMAAEVATVAAGRRMPATSSGYIGAR